MTMTSEPDAFHPSSVQATIEQLRYWVPTIKDVARVFEGKDEQSFLLSIEPNVAAACPVAIAIKGNGRFDIAIAGETYEDRILASLDQFVLLLERIADGHVVQRRWASTVTGVPQGIETIVTLGPDLLGRVGPTPNGGAERRDRHFLPYRRV
jgi:hypothetical protein